MKIIAARLKRRKNMHRDCSVTHLLHIYPSISLPFFDIELTNNNLANVFRAIMGIYIAFNIFWISGALIQSMRIGALWSLFVFYIGAGAGRVLSIVIDGTPDTIFIMYLILEIIGAAISYWLIREIRNNR